MKKRLLFLAILLALTVAPIADSIAKPAYCWSAYARCENSCGNWWVLSVFCDLGCGIGFYNCGNR